MAGLSCRSEVVRIYRIDEVGGTAEWRARREVC